MRNLIALAAFATLTALTSASIADQPIKLAVNDTHFVDSESSAIYRRHACAVSHDQATEHFKLSIRALQTKQKASAVGSRAPAALTRRAVQNPITINTYFHVITTTSAASTITQTMADAQAAALNAAYNPIGITFNLVNTSFTTNDAWAVADGADAVRLGEEFHHNGLGVRCAQIGRVPRALRGTWDRDRLSAVTLDLLAARGADIVDHLVTDRVPLLEAPKHLAALADGRRHAGLQTVYTA